jgi:hypothetical protein
MSAVVTASLLPERTLRRRHEEDDLQAQVMAFLHLALPFDAVANHSPGEGKRTKAAQAALVRSGYCRGWPDVEIIWRGKVYFLELKAAGGTVSAAQRETHRRLIYAGAEVCLCRSLGQVEAQLRVVGMKLRATVGADHAPTPCLAQPGRARPRQASPRLATNSLTGLRNTEQGGS